MRTPRAAGLARLLAAGALACAAIVAASAAGLAKPEAQEITAAHLVACTLATGAEELRQSDQLACLRDRLALASQQLQEVAVVLADAAGQSSEIRAVCHEPAHELARSRYTAGDLQSIFSMSGATACDYGVLHGVIDQAALLDLPESEWRRAVATCQKSSIPKHICADAFGHAIWTQEPQFPTATRHCAEWFTGTDQNDCVNGVVMRMSAPESGAQTRAYSLEEIVRLCADWTRDHPAGESGCGDGVVFAFGSSWLGEAVDRARRANLEPAALESLDQHVKKAAEQCARLSEKASRTCTGGLAADLARQLGAPEIGEQVCARAPEDIKTYCRDRVEQAIS